MGLPTSVKRQFGALGVGVGVGEELVKETFLLLLLDNFFFQKYHFNQGSDNYETCQLIARIHQT